jgi:putative transcriptional regulator
MTKRPYHYTECGLDNVYLMNGFKMVETPRGVGVQIDNVGGLHRAIGLYLLEEKKRLNGKELRFLRHELNMTQETVAALLGVNVQAVARWEKGKSLVTPPADRLMRVIYKEATGGNMKIIDPLRRLAELDELEADDPEQDLCFEETTEEWQPAQAA